MTTYVIKVRGVVGTPTTFEDGSVGLLVMLPGESEETQFIHVDREDGEPMLGIELAHGEAVAGWWPDGEDWSDEIRVPNPLGVFNGE